MGLTSLPVGETSCGRVCKEFSVSALLRILGGERGPGQPLFSFLFGADLACMVQPLGPTVPEVASGSPPSWLRKK